ncbi:MAG: hypothetical protein HKN27_14110 [Silicimonas sp.]|nr:hypothetical protein [Silicimonas sp.]
MTLFSLSFVYLSFYYLALLLAFWRTRSGHAFKSRNSVAAMTVGAVGLLLIYVPALFAPGGAAALILIAALALVPVFLLGLGSLVGLWIGNLKPGVAVQSAWIGLALAVPFALIWTLTAGPTERDQTWTQHNEKLAAFQKTTVKGRLGRYPIAMPASPQIDAYYTCLMPVTGEVDECHTYFGLDAGLGRIPGDVPIFRLVNVTRKSEDCTVSCMNFERLARWCSTRSDMALEEWCKSDPAEEITFSYDENRPEGFIAGWNPAPVSVEGALLDCKAAAQGMTCRARYDIERNLQVTILMRDASPEDLLSRFEAGQDYASRLWSAMKVD